MVTIRKERGRGSRCWAVVVGGLVLVQGLTKRQATELRNQLAPRLPQIVQAFAGREQDRIVGEMQACLGKLVPQAPTGASDLTT